MYKKEMFIRLTAIVSLLFTAILGVEGSYSCNVFIKYHSPITSEFKDIMETNTSSNFPCYKINPQCLNANNYLYFSNSSLQGSKISSNNSISGWKRAGIYGAEFIAAGIVSSGFAIGLFAWISQDFPPNNPLYMGIEYGCERVLGDIFLTAPVTWGVGKIMGQKGSLWKPIIGTGVGSILGTSLALTYFLVPWEESAFEYLRVGLMFALPPIGAVVGYNFK